jgi:hypothetical protein
MDNQVAPPLLELDLEGPAAGGRNNGWMMPSISVSPVLEVVLLSFEMGLGFTGFFDEVNLHKGCERPGWPQEGASRFPSIRGFAQPWNGLVRRRNVRATPANLLQSTQACYHPPTQRSEGELASPFGESAKGMVTLPTWLCRVASAPTILHPRRLESSSPFLMQGTWIDSLGRMTGYRSASPTQAQEALI